MNTRNLIGIVGVVAAALASGCGASLTVETAGSGGQGSGGDTSSSSTAKPGSTGGHGGESPCPGTTECGGVCVDTKLDAANCGGCGMPCAAGQVCSDGACVAGCEATTVSSCTLDATKHGTTATGTCVSGASGSCSFSCSDGTWTQVTDTCAMVVSTLDFQGYTGYMLSNEACGASCNLGDTDQQQTTFACVLAGYTTALTYTVASVTFYPCWCVWNDDHAASGCCADNPGIPTSKMITSITCQ